MSSIPSSTAFQGLRTSLDSYGNYLQPRPRVVDTTLRLSIGLALSSTTAGVPASGTSSSTGSVGGVRDLTRAQAFRAFAAELLSALGQPAAGSAPVPATTGGAASRAGGGVDGAAVGTTPSATGASAASAASGAGSASIADAVGSGDVNAVALALRDALASSTGSPEDGVRAAIDSFNSAIERASQALERRGISEDKIEGFAKEFRRQVGDRLDVLAVTVGIAPALPPGAPTPPATTGSVAAPAGGTAITASPTGSTAGAAPPAGPTTAGAPPANGAPGAPGAPEAAGVPVPGNPESSIATSARYRLTQRGAIELTTLEGDRVTIRFKNQEGFTATGGTASSAAGLAAYASVSAYSQTRFSVDVQGNLNADERAAINDALGQVDTLATQFFKGDLTQAFATGAALNFDPQEIASYSIKLSQKQRLDIITITDGAPPPATTPASGPAPGGTPAASTAAASGGAAGTTGSAAPTASGSGTAAGTPAGNGTGGTAAAAAGTNPPGAGTGSTPPTGTGTAATPGPGDVASAFRSITEYLQQLFAALGTATVAGRVEFSARAKLELVVRAVDAAKFPGSAAEGNASDFLRRVIASTTDARTAASGPAP